ncbi:MAG: L-aspartate oxidase [Gammaproteobacteria bacterium RIFCSPHIGHO2_12_FULL_35_23]|nr:MAG: L-aspartate oxidase [Gammaproteobacteria bacterium RIFCSPHIGHO2_12_FULL_35_23]
MKEKPQSQQGQRKIFDVLVMGSGIAGLSYILELLQLKPSVKIALIAKKNLAESNSFYAQGGIAAALNNKAEIEKHFQDTLLAGAHLCNKKATLQILEKGHDAIETLIRQKVVFAQSEGHYSLAQEAGHSTRRIYNCEDHTGKTIITALIDTIKTYPQVTLFEYHTAIELITQNKLHKPGDSKEVIGAYILNESTGKIDTFLANAVILATGGAGKVYRYTTNPETATGDGIAMAYRAGARVGNLEFYQFHPTLLYHHHLNNFLISEALRGEGAYLLKPDTLQRFMHLYAPEKKELATRDIVAKAIFTEMEKSAHNFIYLDVRHINKDLLIQRFPTIYQTLLGLGIDFTQHLIPVVPAAHYLCGGVLTNVYGQTDLQRLYAIGETAFTGLHGANRLASNSLLEGVVTGKLTANQSLPSINTSLQLRYPIRDWDSQHVTDLRRASQINALWRGLRGEMTSYAGIVRTEAGLNDLLKLLYTRREMIEGYYRKHAVTRDVVELRNISLIAKLIVNSALFRKESRGSHYREDYPDTNSRIGDTILRGKDLQFNFQDQYEI